MSKIDVNGLSREDLLLELEALREKVKSLEAKESDQQLADDQSMYEAEKSLQQSLENVDLMALTVDREGFILFCNQLLLKTLGKTSEEILNKNIFETLIPKEDLEDSILKFNNFLDSNKVPENFEGRILTKDKHIIEVKFSSIILHNYRDRPKKLTIIGENITESKKVKKALEKTNAQLKELFDNSHDLIQIFSNDGSFQFVNEAWKEKLGYKANEIGDIKLFDIVHPLYKENTRKNLERIANGDIIEKFETVFISKYGADIYLSGRINCNFDKENGQLSEFRGIFHDITERIRAEKAQRLYFSIASLTIQSSDLLDLYYNIHKELNKIIRANNFYIALVNESDNFLNFPYYIDEHYFSNQINIERQLGKGLTEYAISQNRALFLTKEDILRLANEDTVEIMGPLPKVWLGVPLKLERRTIGVIAVQDYHNRATFNLKDLELLDFISGQVALAIERKQNEEKLSNQTARLNAIFESSTHLIWSVNRNFELTSFNQNFSDATHMHFGVKPQLEVGKRKGKRVFVHHRDYQKFWYHKYKEAFNGKVLHFETIFKDERYGDVWKEIFLNPIYLTDGSIPEVSGIAHDITKRKQSELALLESEEKFRNIFESFQDIYFRCNLLGEITMVSPSIYEMSGYSPDQVLGKNITDYYLYNTKTKDLIRRLVKTRSVRNFEASIVHQDGRIIQCICNVRLLRQPKKSLQIEGIVRDITQLKKVNLDLMNAKDLAERSLKVKERFLANMSHEIRTPMNGIIGMIDLLADTNLDTDQRDYVDTIKKSSETLLNILNDILDLSKIEAGKMEIRKSAVYLREVMEKLYSLYVQQSYEKGISLSYLIHKDVPEYVLLDETRFLQILSNLTSNAIKFTGNGGSIFITLSKKKKTGKRYQIEVEVKDTGIGISPENLDKLFRSFSQIDNSSTKSYAGTGLGLAISKELCRLMNGDIGVESTLGEGSTFWFTFATEETVKENVPESSVQENNDDPEKIEGVVPYILLVDDNQINREVASKILQKAGCRIKLACNGIEAINIVKEDTFDLIFMDIQMPEMDGVTATRKIKEMKLKNTPPIVAMTAYSMKEDRQKFLDQGLDDYISKPIRSNALIRKVKELLKLDLIPEEVEKTHQSFSQMYTDDVINQEVINQLKKYGDEEMIRSLYLDFEIESKKLLENCEEAYKGNNYKEILSNLHTLKGNAGTLGINKIASKAASVEADLKKGDYSNLFPGLERLKELFTEFQDHYNKIET